MGRQVHPASPSARARQHDGRLRPVAADDTIERGSARPPPRRTRSISASGTMLRPFGRVGRRRAWRAPAAGRCWPAIRRVASGRSKQAQRGSTPSTARPDGISRASFRGVAISCDCDNLSPCAWASSASAAANSGQPPSRRSVGSSVAGSGSGASTALDVDQRRKHGPERHGGAAPAARTARPGRRRRWRRRGRRPPASWPAPGRRAHAARTPRPATTVSAASSAQARSPAPRHGAPRARCRAPNSTPISGVASPSWPANSSAMNW